MVPTESDTRRRTEIHTREFSCKAYQCDDGLIELEGKLIDSKPESLDFPDHRVEAGEPIHEMVICMRVDQDCVIRAVEAETLAGPNIACGAIAPAYGALVGLTIGPGFSREVKSRFRGYRGCTHLTEMFPLMATTLFQAMWSDLGRFARGESWSDGRSLSAIGGCHVLHPDSEFVRRNFSSDAKEE